MRSIGQNPTEKQIQLCVDINNNNNNNINKNKWTNLNNISKKTSNSKY